MRVGVAEEQVAAFAVFIQDHRLTDVIGALIGGLYQPIETRFSEVSHDNKCALKQAQEKLECARVISSVLHEVRLVAADMQLQKIAQKSDEISVPPAVLDESVVDIRSAFLASDGMSGSEEDVEPDEVYDFSEFYYCLLRAFYYCPEALEDPFGESYTDKMNEALAMIGLPRLPVLTGDPAIDRELLKAAAQHSDSEGAVVSDVRIETGNPFIDQKRDANSLVKVHIDRRQPIAREDGPKILGGAALFSARQMG